MNRLIGKQIIDIKRSWKPETSKTTLKIVVEDGLTFEISGNLTHSVKESQECDYCGEYRDKVRPTPFMADGTAMMCKMCWDMTRDTYKGSSCEDIGPFEDYPHFEKESEKA